MNLTDRFILALLATLFLAVLIIERRRFRNLPLHVQPPPLGEWILGRTNVPAERPQGALLTDVTYKEICDSD
jgi:hypothetical protein